MTTLASSLPVIPPVLSRSAAHKLALGLVNLAQLTRVEVVALSGSIALKHEGFLDELCKRVEARRRGMPLRRRRG